MLSLKLLGALSLTRDGVPERGPVAQRRRLALLAMLGAHAKGGLSREKVIGYLWPDTAGDQARRLLADSIYVLRKALGQDAILAAADNIELNTAVVGCDVAAFHAALAAGDDAAAVDAYGGPFLDGFFVPDAPEFSLWCDAQAAELARKYTDALARLAEQSGIRSDHVAAAAWWRRLQAADPLNSRVALQLASALEAAGERAAALRHIEQHQKQLVDELGIAPDAGLAAAEARLRAAPPAAPLGRPTHVHALDSAPLIEQAAPPVPAHTPLRPRRLRTAAILSMVAVFAVITAAYFAARQGAPRPERVVVQFENRTGDAAVSPIAQITADWIGRGLLQTGAVELVSPAWAAGTNVGDNGQPRVMARQFGAGTIISGALYRDGERLRVEAAIIDAARGSILHSLEPVMVRPDSILIGLEPLRQRAITATVTRLGRSENPGEFTLRVQPPTFAAYSEYVEGVQRFARFEPEAAARHFARAWALDSTFHLPRLYSVLLAYNRGRLGVADSMVEQLAVHRSDMSLFDRALFDAFDAERRRDRHDVLRAMRRVAALTPRSQFVVGYAVAAVAVNRPREALTALESLNPAEGLVQGNLRYWDWLTTARHMLGQHRRELRDARAGGAHVGDPDGVVIPEIRALAALGRWDELDDRMQDLRTRKDIAALLMVAASEARAHGNPGLARRYAVSAADSHAAALKMGQSVQSGLGEALYQAEEWDRARAVYEQLVSADGQNEMILGRLGTLAARRGDHAEAARMATLLAQSAQANSNTIVWRGRIAAQLGQTELAVNLLKAALAEYRPHGLWLHTDPDLAGLRGIAEFERLLQPSD